MGELLNFLFFKIFFDILFCNIILIKFQFKFPTNQSCSIDVFYKDRLQSLKKRSFSEAEKNLADFED